MDNNSNNDADTIQSYLFKMLRISSTMNRWESSPNSAGLIGYNSHNLEETSSNDSLDIILPNPQDPSSVLSRFKRSRIQFNSVVEVIHIPSRSEYSEGIKKFIWASSAEIRQNAIRNRREFAAEGWKWENAVEEDDMYFDKFSNERIHPVHLGGISDLR